MLHESFYREPPKDTVLPPYEIKMGIRFKPFEQAEGFYRPHKADGFFYAPEEYPHSVVLRREVLLHGIKGNIDVITDDNRFLFVPIEAVKMGKDIEMPLGETHFHIGHYEGTRIPKPIEEPCILRFSFPVRNPAEYTKLLETYADVELGDDMYVLAWNNGRLSVRRRMKRLETGENLLIVQKNLFNLKSVPESVPDQPITSEENDELEQVDEMPERVTFVWIPKKIQPLQSIAMTFNRFDQGDDREQTIEPPPSKDLILQQAA